MNMKRYQIDMSPQGVARINELKEFTGARTNKDIFDEALTLLDWAVVQVRSGRLIASIDDDKKLYRELAMPCLDNARRSAGFANVEPDEAALRKAMQMVADR